MIHAANIRDLLKLERGEDSGLIIIHTPKDFKLVDQLDPISEALGIKIMQIKTTPAVRDWVDHGSMPKSYPLAVLFKPNRSIRYLVRPKIQQVVDMCLGKGIFGNGDE